MFGGRQWSYISFCEHVARRRLFGLVCVDRTKRPLSALRWEGPRGGGFPPKEKPHHALYPRKNHITLLVIHGVLFNSIRSRRCHGSGLGECLRSAFALSTESPHNIGLRKKKIPFTRKKTVVGESKIANRKKHHKTCGITYYYVLLYSM
jgi:hypothetical protein